MKNKDFWKVFLFIIKVTFIGFGGGNALMPIIKKYAVEENKWITEKEFNDAIIAVNLIPGPAVIEMLSYISITKLGKLLGTLVVLLAVMPHVILSMILFYLSNFLPIKYLFVLNVAVLPVLIGVILVFAYRYFKTSFKNLTLSIWIALFMVSLAFCLFVPAPFNIPAIPLIIVILFVFIFEFIKAKRKVKK
ncbi:chromate transporter [Mesomycoplasma molare]|uniref:Chromate transporter n=1 Tax=Mesomycoplasma molare TaxID=171288 RepID=A0ABY5TV85_9BACT|nr:chromate transporter [Mesomycoplasma molare]UWD34150.1 chromate transporter [Mesomycoplasma molare]